MEKRTILVFRWQAHDDVVHTFVDATAGNIGNQRGQVLVEVYRGYSLAEARERFVEDQRGRARAAARALQCPVDGGW